jgi:geranylgeranyl reductase family protein
MYDVAVIGAGPAGAWAAYQLASSGARVAIVDGSHPREKPCGGGLTSRALDIVCEHLRGPASDGVPIASGRFESGGHEAGVPLRPGALHVVARRSFDAALLSAAQSAGAQHISARASDIRSQPGGWSVTAGGSTICAGWIVGADGANSLVRRQVHRPFPRSEISVAAGYFVHGHHSSMIGVAFIDEPPGYLWAFPRADHLAVGACAQANETSSAEMLRYSAEWIRAHVGAPERTWQRYSWPVPSLSEAALHAEHPAGRGWMLVGDAAGLVDPITREGIYFALRSGEYAAQALGQSKPEEYVSMLRQEVYPELAHAARLKRRFFRPHFTRLLMRALQRSPRVRLVMADLVAGEQPYRGLRRRLLTTREWGLLLELIRGRRVQAT